MPTFQYTAKDKSSQTVMGTLDAPSEAEAANILHNKEFIVVSLKESKKKAGSVKGKKVKLDELVIFSRQLATMIDAGNPLVQT